MILKFKLSSRDKYLLLGLVISCTVILWLSWETAKPYTDMRKDFPVNQLAKCYLPSNDYTKDIVCNY